MSISDLSDEVQSRLLDLIWDQWTHLGVAGHRSSRLTYAIDPEALLLATFQIARTDPRLFDEVLDWLARNGRHLSLQRLSNLTPRFPVDPTLVDAVIAWAAATAPSLRWPIREPPSQVREPVDLFPRALAGFAPNPDPVFERYGYRRPPIRASRKSQAPDVRARPNLALRLRLVFGPGSRAEVMRILLTARDTSLDAARIADEAAFAKRNVHETLTSLSESGAVKSRWFGNQRVFTIFRKRWAVALEVGPSEASLPRLVSWVHLLPALVRLDQWMQRAAADRSAAYLLASQATDVWNEIRPDLEAAGLAIEPLPLASDPQFWEGFGNAVGAALLIPETGER
jgi:hypothetical protein